MQVPDDADGTPVFGAGFKSHGLEWKLVLMPNGESGEGDGRQRVCLDLLRGWPKKVSAATSVIDKGKCKSKNLPTNQPLAAHDSSQTSPRCVTSSGS